MKEIGLENLTRMTYRKTGVGRGTEENSNNPKWMAKQGEFIKRKTLLRATQDRKSWRARTVNINLHTRTYLVPDSRKNLRRHSEATSGCENCVENQWKKTWKISTVVKFLEKGVCEEILFIVVNDHSCPEGRST